MLLTITSPPLVNPILIVNLHPNSPLLAIGLAIMWDTLLAAGVATEGESPLTYKLRQAVKANYQQIIFVIMAFLAMILVSYFYVSGIVRKQMRSLGEEMITRVEMAVSANLKEGELSFVNMVQTTESMLESRRSNEELLAMLKTVQAFYSDEQSPLPDFMKVYGYIRGEFLDGSDWQPPATYVPAERPWYVGAAGSEGIFFSEPYEDADTGDVCISFSKKICDVSGENCGILAMDLDLSQVTHYLDSQRLAGNGFGVFVSDSMTFVAHQEPELIGMTMEEAGPGYKKLAKAIGNGEEISAYRFTDFDGIDSVAFFATIFNGWHIGIITPRASYFSQVNSLAWVLGILGAILSLVLCYMLVMTQAAKMRSDDESRSKTEFLSRMSHEMRTPMNAIIGMTRIALDADDCGKAKQAVEKINSASKHLLGVINDILDMSKIEAGKLDIHVEETTLQEILDQVKTVIQYKVEERQQHFTVECIEPMPPSVFVDKQRLAQIIANLLGNAVKFTPEGGHVGLCVSCQEEKEGHLLTVTVTDDGIGISKEQQTRLFRAFEQADGSISRKYGGSGLGLAITKQIVELMGGKVWLRSELGKGSIFTFSIPVKVGQGSAAESAEVASEGAETEEGMFLGKRILVAEDVDINREILTELLAHTGVQIACAVDGAQAVEMFAAYPEYDLIFMDIHMPQVDGYEATRRIRSLEGIPAAATIPIIAMTADVFKEDIDQCLAAGMNDHVGKPLDIDVVLRKMKQYMQ